MYLRRAWYVAGWSSQFPAGSVVARTILDRPLVMYRTEAGPVAAMEDRCPHRFAPLSRGRLEGDNLRCMYHGLAFAPDGRCVDVPTGDEAPAGLRARALPVVEQDRWIWVWMGEPEQADPALIPRPIGHEDAHYHLETGEFAYGANFQLVHDNLIDLTHLGFLHEKTFGSMGSRWGEAEPAFAPLADGVRVQRWLRGHPIAPYMNAAPGLRMDQWAAHDVLVPGLFRLAVDSYPVGTADAHPDGPGALAPTFRTVTSHAVTPVSRTETVFFYSVGQLNPNATPEGLSRQHRLFQRAFVEDKDMLEAQQAVVDRSPGQAMATLSFDRAIPRFRRIMARLMEAEATAAA